MMAHCKNKSTTEKKKKKKKKKKKLREDESSEMVEWLRFTFSNSDRCREINVVFLA